MTKGFLHNDDQVVLPRRLSICSLMKCEMRITVRAGAIGGGGNLPRSVDSLLFGPLPAKWCILLSFRQSFLFYYDFESVSEVA